MHAQWKQKHLHGSSNPWTPSASQARNRPAYTAGSVPAGTGGGSVGREKAAPANAAVRRKVLVPRMAALVRKDGMREPGGFERSQ